MTRKIMRSLPSGRLAACQCLVLSLLVSMLLHARAWVPSPATKRSTFGWNAKNAAESRRPTPTSLGVGEGVMDFIQGLDSTLGNPTAYSAAKETTTEASAATVVSSSVNAYQSSGGAVNMNIPNSVVLVGGGVAFLAFLGLAFYFLTQKDGSTNTEARGFSGDMSFGIEEVAPLPKRIVDENVLSQQLEAAETRFQEQKQQQPSREPATTVTDSKEVPSGNLLEKLKAKLLGKTEELEENQELLKEETDRRRETESKLIAVNTQIEGLTEELATKDRSLLETTEKWNYTKTKLQSETKLKETFESEMKLAAESNRLLEDKFELEQNALRKTKTDLDTTKLTLESTQGRLTRTQGELTRVHGELQTTQKVLSETCEDLENLEEEQRSFRRLGGKIWGLSKSRVSNRIKSVGDRLRGRGRKNNKKTKKNWAERTTEN
jgi:hypothetical protein